jgi:hypothetical protein
MGYDGRTLAGSSIVQSLNELWKLSLRWWKVYTTRDFLNWFKRKYELAKPLGRLPTALTTWDHSLRGLLKGSPEATRDWMAGRECISRFVGATWWEWSAGSRPLFWR